MRVDANYGGYGGIRFEFAPWVALRKKRIRTLHGFTINGRCTAVIDTEDGHIKISYKPSR